MTVVQVNGQPESDMADTKMLHMNVHRWLAIGTVSLCFIHFSTIQIETSDKNVTVN
jgi:hypothetical protein